MLHCNVGNKLINRRPTQRNLLCLRVETLALFAVVLFGFGPTAGATIPVAPAVVVVVVTKHVPAEFWCPTLAIAFELTKVWVQALRETMDGEYFLCMTREHRVGVRCEHACMHCVYASHLALFTVWFLNIGSATISSVPIAAAHVVYCQWTVGVRQYA